MSQNIRAFWEPLRTLAFGSISGTYAALGTPLANPSRNLKINNQTNVLLTFSTDGTNDMFVVPASSAVIYDISEMRVATGEDASIPANTQFYVKGAPGSGSVYLETLYLA